MDDPEEIFRQTYASLHNHMKSLGDKLYKRWDKGQYWWELRSCAYYHAFEQPKILWKDLAFHSAFCFQSASFLTNDLCFVFPSNDRWLVAVLNSPLIWAYMWRNVIHGKGEVLRLKNLYTEALPIALPTDEVRGEAEEAMARLISLTTPERKARWDTLDWLRVEFGVDKPGQKLEAFASLDAEAFVEEMRKRRPKNAGRFTPVTLKELDPVTPRWQRRYAKRRPRQLHWNVASRITLMRLTV